MSLDFRRAVCPECRGSIRYRIRDLIRVEIEVEGVRKRPVFLLPCPRATCDGVLLMPKEPKGPEIDA